MTALLCAMLSQQVIADDFAIPAGAEFKTFAVEELDLRVAPQSRADAVGAGNATTIPGYPLSQEELGLVLDTSKPGQEFSQKMVGVAFADEQDKQPFRIRVVTWIKQRSSHFNLLRLFDADAGEPGLHVDVDTDEDELMLQYRVGF